MPTLLSDPPFLVYIALCAAVLVLAAVAFSKKQRGVIVALAAAIVLLAILGIIDRAMESPREEAVRRATAMAAAADAKNPAAFVEHVADTVELGGSHQPRTVTKEQLRMAGLWGLLKQYNVRVTAWDFSRGHVKEIDANTIEIGFMAKGEAEGKPYPLFVRATFAKQPNGEFKLVKFGTFNPANHNEPLAIPSFP